MATAMHEFVYELDTMSEEEWEFVDNRLDLEQMFTEAGHSHYRIDGRGMTWQRLDRWTVVEATDVLQALVINGDYRLVVTRVEGEDEIRAVRYSHDEPTGASFTIRPANLIEISEWN